MIADDLSKAQICEEFGGRIHAAGLSGGYCYYERSGDGGATKQVFPNGATWRLVSLDPVEDEGPAIEVTASGIVLVALTQAGKVRVYRSWLDGWSFDLVGATE